MYYSLSRFNSNHKIIAFVDETIYKDKQLVKWINRLPNVETIDIDKGKFEKIKSKNQYIKAYYKFLIYTLNFDKIIFLDSDLVILQNIENLFNLKGKFHAVVEMEIPQFNTGVMVVCDPEIDTFNELIETANNHPNAMHGDQDIFNHVLKNPTPLPFEYNVLKSYHRHLGTWINSCKILHYISKKPWQSYDPKTHKEGNVECAVIETIWFDLFEKAKKELLC